MLSYSMVPVAAIVGNEDGAHFCSAQLLQSLNDVGFTIPTISLPVAGNWRECDKWAVLFDGDDGRWQSGGIMLTSGMGGCLR